MSQTQSLETAIEIAHLAHEGQMRRQEGVAYIEHPLRVMSALAMAGYSEETQITGVMHDVVEDSDFTLDDLADLGFQDSVLIPIELLTKDPAIDYMLGIQRIAPNARARAVKRYDLVDNMNLDGIENPRLKDVARLHKYGDALVYLAQFGFPLV